MENQKYILANNYKKRREQLKQNRRIEFWQATWRLFFLLLVTGGICWAIALPNWLILRKSQIQIQGNQYLTSDAIKELLELSYPTSVLEIQSQKLIQQLKDNAAIEEVIITRQLLPPGAIVTVRDRPPVAIALSPQTQLDDSESYSKEIGFLDEKGIWMPKSSYQNDLEKLQIPNFKVIGNSSHYSQYWPEIYPIIQQATIKIYELNWEDPSNTILRTTLGKVHLGAYSSLARFQEQLAVLSKMQELPNKMSLGQIDYIDLKDPNSPQIQVSSL